VHVKISIKITGVAVEIRTGYLQNASQKYYRLSRLPRWDLEIIMVFEGRDWVHVAQDRVQ
jgi:hypothetical protein